MAAPALLDSYEAERRPAGEAIVGRAVRIAFTDEMDHDDEKAQFLHEMQMTHDLPGHAAGRRGRWRGDVRRSPGGRGDRAPDVGGLRRFGVGHPMRLFELTAGPIRRCCSTRMPARRRSGAAAWRSWPRRIRQSSGGQVHPYLVTAPDLPVPTLVDLPVLRDADSALPGCLRGRGNRDGRLPGAPRRPRRLPHPAGDRGRTAGAPRGGVHRLTGLLPRVRGPLPGR